MPPRPVRVVSASESVERDRAAIEAGVPSRVLMERAGTGAANEIMRRYAEPLREGAVVFTGPGNNGGDGWVVSGCLARAGINVTVIEVVAAKSPNAVAWKQAAIDLVTPSDRAPEAAGVAIDALLGTGSEGEPRGRIAEGIATINRMRSGGAHVAALDLPSGLDATTGSHSTCVVADVSLSFGAVKRGSLLGRDCCGEIVVLDIGLDDNAGVGGDQLPVLIDGQWVKSRIPPISYDAHKGTRKHLAVVGGGPGMPGSVVLGCRAALRSGIGLVRALVAPDNVSAIVQAVPSSLISEWPTSKRAISSEISEWADAIVIGPGLGRSDKTRKLVEKILKDSEIPVLIDADALNVFEDEAGVLGKLLRGRPALITPHVAEFARLAGVGVSEVLANRFDIGGELARTLGATVLLKGSPTVIFSPAGERFVVARGTAALGTGGSGDILAGIGGTLLAQTADALAAATCSAWIHGRAAELCGYVRGTTLEDVLYALPRAWNETEPVPEPPVLANLPAVAT
ncbi:MAG: NAD(P)H-hydrate dehydratase [Gemmatimonadota bacterium]|nr:NAD(P)H-hydrate dehydratase [Gemmatimonadota bacterium]